MRKWRKERDRGPAVVSTLRRATVLPPWMAESSLTGLERPDGRVEHL